jgi:hypothetical protein
MAFGAAVCVVRGVARGSDSGQAPQRRGRWSPARLVRQRERGGSGPNRESVVDSGPNRESVVVWW